MHVAPWDDAASSATLPGVLRRLRGEWPCVPFGRCDAPLDLPPGWQTQAADDEWPHGYGANQAWTCVHAAPDAIELVLDYPADSPISRLERHIRVVPGAPALDIGLKVWARRTFTLPVALHPTFRLPSEPGRVQVELGPHQGVFSYPSRNAGDGSRLVPDRQATSLAELEGHDGPIDLSQLPLLNDCEELLQVRAVSAPAGAAPVQLHYLDHGLTVELSWQTEQLPDVMLWISNRGRQSHPWCGQHVALGVEPVNGVFDLGRVARPPAAHALADRTGITLEAGQCWSTNYRIAARALATPVAA